MVIRAGHCKRCGREMKWTGKIFITCEHCGQLQTWPVDAEEGSNNSIWEDKERRKNVISNFIQGK